MGYDKTNCLSDTPHKTHSEIMVIGLISVKFVNKEEDVMPSVTEGTEEQLRLCKITSIKIFHV